MLSGQRVYLRPINSDDWQMILDIKSDIGNLLQLTTKLSPMSRDAAVLWTKKVSESFDAQKFSIIENSTNYPIGYIGFNNLDIIEGHTGFAFQIMRDSQGQGYGTEALNLFIEYAFRYLGIRKVFTHILASNSASTKVVEKCGFKIEGVLRKHVLRDRKPIDVVIYGLLYEESIFAEGS